MMRAAFTSFLLGTALAFPLAGCAALDVLSGDLILNKTWFPFLDGSTWEYNVRNADGEVGTASIALTGVTMGDDGTGEGTITYRFPTRPTFSTEIRKTATGIQLAGQAELLKLPAKVGDSWSANATSDVLNVLASQQPTCVVVGTQNLEYTNDGAKTSTNALRIDVKGFGLLPPEDASSDPTVDTSKLKAPILRRWYADGVGLVRQTSTMAPMEGWTVELTKYTAPAPPQ